MSNNPDGNPNQPFISTSVLVALLLVNLLGFDFLNEIREAAQSSGASGYWTIVVAFVLFIPVFYLIGAFQSRFPGKNLFEVAQLAIGQPLATIGNIVFLLIFIGWLIVAIGDLTDLVLNYLLNQTPLWVVLLAILIGIGYLALQGLVGVSRLASFILIPTLLIRILMQLFALQNISLTHLLPFVSSEPIDYLIGGLKIANVFLPLITLFLFCHYVEEPQKIKGVSLKVSVLIMLLFLLEIIGGIGVFGSEYVQKFIWPNLALIKCINIPYLVLEQIGPVFLIVWITVFIVGGGFYMYIVANGLQQLFPRLNYKLLVLTLLVIVGIGGLIFPNAVLVGYLFEMIRRFSIIPAIGYPVLIYIIAVIRGKGRKNS
ncbi:MAG TPA: endospore germination permease [Bacillota bacterium]|nr:endospore germination permease [Bacillota bacterium]HOL09759.1 endospore germination permease [Bacillota bacterium]HPO98561.1 endospore germination permease [Bacillota bacterium]